MTPSLRILLVDAEPETRERAERLLRADGYQITASPDLKHALATCFAGRFDAVFLDLDLLAGTETGLVRRLRDHVSYKSLPILGFAKRPGIRLAPGSGLDLVVDGLDPQTWLKSLHALRQARGFLAAPQASPLARY